MHQRQGGRLRRSVLILAASTRTATGSISDPGYGGLGDDTRHGCSIYGQAEVSNRGIVKALPDLKPKLFSHAQHGRVLAKNFSCDPLQVDAAGVLDDPLHQPPAEAYDPSERGWRT